MVQIALTRDVSPDMDSCELSFVGRSEIDVALARTQHEQYQKALASLGCKVIALPALAGSPDAVFVEDTALVLNEIAISTRPGAPSRRVEVASVADVLGKYRRLVSINDPGTLDGGDILVSGRKIFVGLSARSNPEAIRQLGELVEEYGYHVLALEINGCLHLKSAVTLLDDETVLVQPAWIDPDYFSDYRVIEVDQREEHAANALRAGSGVVYPSCFPRTQELVQDAGIELTTVDVSELQKAEGAVTCCSIIFRADE
jgi:dimethylargininase